MCCAGPESFSKAQQKRARIRGARIYYLLLFIYLFFPVGPSRETPGNLSQLFKGAIIQTPGDTEAAQIAFLSAVMRLRSVLVP